MQGRAFPFRSLSPAPPFPLPHWLVGKLTPMEMELLSFHMVTDLLDGRLLHVSMALEDPQ
ncbi:hypothetical protein V8D89_003460, partial [Ganoderma adspersum]